MMKQRLVLGRTGLQVPGIPLAEALELGWSKAGVEQGWREVLEVSEAQMLGLSPLPSCSLELFCLILCLPIQHWEVRSVTAEVRSHLHQYLRQPAALLLCYILGCGVFGL